MSKSLG